MCFDHRRAHDKCCPFRGGCPLRDYEFPSRQQHQALEFRIVERPVTSPLPAVEPGGPDPVDPLPAPGAE